MSCGRLEDSSIEGGTGDTEASADFGDRVDPCPAWL
jgi:hypothetical protein